MILFSDLITWQIKMRKLHQKTATRRHQRNNGKGSGNKPWKVTVTQRISNRMWHHLITTHKISSLRKLRSRRTMMVLHRRAMRKTPKWKVLKQKIPEWRAKQEWKKRRKARGRRSTDSAFQQCRAIGWRHMESTRRSLSMSFRTNSIRK